MKFLKAALALTLFLLLLCGIYVIHSQFFTVNVVFYAALADGLLATLLTTAAMRLIPWFRGFNGFETFLLTGVWALLAYILAISVPTVLDRSLSFYILEKLQQRGGAIQQSGFQLVFSQEYMKEHRLVDVRLTEQMESGTITIENGCVRLTPKGEQIATASRYFRQHFLPKKRLLMGQYSDDLVDPFRHSAPTMDYGCDPRQ